MTATATTTDKPFELDAEAALSLQSLLGRGVAVLDILAELDLVAEPELPTPAAPPTTPPITEAQRDALVKIQKIFGKIVPTSRRKLTKAEINFLVEERETIDLLLLFLEARKTSAIREYVANHFDVVAEEALDEDSPVPPVDDRGHYLLKQEVVATEHGKKFTRETRQGKLQYDHVGFLQAQKAGLVDRRAYLALTVKPEVERVIDADAASRAIAKDPSLLGVLAKYGTKPGRASSSIFLRKV
jgi:hypothetical protein